MIRRPPRSTLSSSSAASDVYKRQGRGRAEGLEEERGGPPGPFEDLEVVRLGAGMPTSRFCALIGMPERTWRRHQARARAARPVKGPWPRPARVRKAVRAHALAHPAWGHRKVWAMVRYDGHRVSAATVLRLLRDEGLILEANYQRERRELAAHRRAAFATAPTGPNQVWQLDNSRVRDHVRWDLADRRLPGLLEQVRAPVPHLPDREPARRDRRGRARPGRGCRAGRSAAARPRPGRPARQRPARRDDRDRQRRAVPVLPVRGVHRHPPRASPRPHPSAHPRPERLTRTRLRLPEVRTAVPRRDPRRDRPGRPRRALPDRVQHRPTPREPVLEPPNRGPPRLHRPEDPQLPRARKPAICLTRDRWT